MLVSPSFPFFENKILVFISSFMILVAAAAALLFLNTE